MAKSSASYQLSWKEAQAAAEAMLQAVKNRDTVVLGIAADNLEQNLTNLWDLRASQDIDWATILNHVQGMMRQFFREKRAETLTEDQCSITVRLVRDYLEPSTKTVDDLNEALRLISDAGFDPYAAISWDF